ncbi:MAG: hypothetical protein GX616_17120 [Planctomycetes bacterium]|nr:hypothetical protein [Planctomycetota bacterium]
MGLFLSMLACRSDSQDRVCEAIVDVIGRRGTPLLGKQKVDRITGEEDKYAVTLAENGWVQVFMPETPDPELAQEISRLLGAPVFQFHIHDGDLWMYELFSNGKQQDRFCQIPDYWADVDDSEKSSWQGNPSVLSSLFNVPERLLRPYFVFTQELDTAGLQEKAFPDDRFPIGSEWAMTDFQRKLAIRYPDFGQPKTVELACLVFGGPSPTTPASPPTKPWWRFW